MFLTTCLKWKHHKKKGPDFRSHLPMSINDTYNEYQHLSKINRDPINRRATNLIPTDKPEDMYQQTADCANHQIEKDTKNTKKTDQDTAQQLLKKIDRSDAKHATMTTPYSVTQKTIYKI